MVGHRIQNLDAIKPLHYCSYCSLLLRDAVQLIDCGHRLCQSCVDEQQGDMIICSECYKKTSREELKPDRGFRNDMKSLLIICALCNWIGVLKDYQNHLDTNHPNPTCDYCNQKFTSVNDLNRHKQLICEKITVYCPLKSIGCDVMIPRIDLSKHYLSDQHQKALINFVCQKRQENLRQTTYMIIAHLQEIDETTNVLSNGVETLSEDVKRLGIESVNCQNTLQPVIQELPILKKSIDEQNAFMDSMKTNQEIREQDVLSLKQKMDYMKWTSHDGTFIWKITNVQDKIAAAKADRQTSFYSPPFYSSPTGYKMCLRIYLDGDGTARKTHISLFFVLMRGEYDAILKFPFCFKVIFCLYDQTDRQHHIIDSFQPNVKSNSFQRPRSEMNIASGIPKFAPLTIFEQENNPYIRDDTMFIKVLINFGNIPKEILPYVFGLSPGLTTQIQQTMIQQEIKKHQPQQQISNSATTDQSISMDSQETKTLSNIPSNKINEQTNLINDEIKRMID